jgi:hypothetical protein
MESYIYLAKTVIPKRQTRSTLLNHFRVAGGVVMTPDHVEGVSLANTFSQTTELGNDLPEGTIMEVRQISELQITRLPGILQLQTAQLPRLQTAYLPGNAEGDQSDRFSGVEVLDLSQEDPQPTKRFSVFGHKKAQFVKPRKDHEDSAAWQLARPDDQLQFKLMLPRKQGVVFILEIRRTIAGNAPDSPLGINVNDHEWKVEIDPHNLRFHKQSWYLPHYMLEEGKNLITVKLAPGARTQVMLRSASVMRFDLQMQKQTKWCWAAVTASLIRFFDPDRDLSQCQVVKKCRPKVAVCPVCREDVFCAHCADVDPCTDGANKASNRTYKLSDALEKMNVRFSRCNYPIPLDEVRRQIHEGLPVAVRIDWGDGRGHFVVITAVGPADPRGDNHTWLRVANPEDQVASYIAYRTLRDSYNGEGQWTHTYLFKRNNR